MTRLQRFLPALVLAAGWGLLLRAGQQQVLPLRDSLSTLPAALHGLQGRDIQLDPEVEQVAGTTAYRLLSFTRDTAQAFSLYVGYYASQIQGQTIHSPKNCLPGSGWEPVQSGSRVVTVDGKAFTVNRYLIANGGVRALVYYWYQGRGRVSANEYVVKWELLRDKVLFRRSDEALVRIVVPLSGPGADEEQAERLADAVATAIIPEVFEVLPAGPGSLASPSPQRLKSAGSAPTSG